MQDNAFMLPDETINIGLFMRKIRPAEVNLISFLAKIGERQLILHPEQLVWDVNKEMKSIRADCCPKGYRVRSVAQYDFKDSDEVPIVATLFVAEDGHFGELDFWKVNDEPVLILPSVPPGDHF